MAFITIKDLQVGDIVEAKIRTAPYQVTDIVDSVVLFVNEAESFIMDSGYVNLINRNPQVRFIQNQQSGISHAILATGKSLCGSRYTQVGCSADEASCKKCRRQISIMVLLEIIIPGMGV